MTSRFRRPDWMRCAALALALVSLAVRAELPRGWLADGAVEKFQVYRDPGGWRGYPMLAVRPTSSVDPTGWAWANSTFRAERWRGLRIRLSGMVHTEVSAGWAGLWIQAERGLHEGERPDLEHRAATLAPGRTPWRRYMMVVDVPPNADTITFGCLAAGRAAAWCAELNIEEVGRDVPSTHGPVPWIRSEPQLDLSL